MGLHQIYPAQRGGRFSVDVVLVHGLCSDSSSAWTKNDITWPRDLLPHSLGYCNARILTFSYAAEGFLSANTKTHGVRTFTCAESLLSDLRDYRIMDPKRPIIFVGHSLGGLVIKSALVHANIRNQVYGIIAECTKAIVFFSTPHQGSDNAAWDAFFTSLDQANLQGAQVVEELRLWSDMLVQLTVEFADLARFFRMTSFFETRGSKGVFVVKEASARIGQFGERPRGLDADHIGICKFVKDDDNWGIVQARFEAIAYEIGIYDEVTHSVSQPARAPLALEAPQEDEDDLVRRIQQNLHGSMRRN